MTILKHTLLDVSRLRPIDYGTTTSLNIQENYIAKSQERISLSLICAETSSEFPHVRFVFHQSAVLIILKCLQSKIYHSIADASKRIR